VRIARFVDMKACKCIFSEFSTFVLRSATHYRRRYETDRGDAQELRARTADGGSAEVTSVALSCWTMLDGDEPTQDERGEWNIFPDSVVAIVSTPDRVCTFLKEAFEIGKGDARRHPFWCVEHKPVQYGVAEEITFDNIWEEVAFTKRNLPKFTKQKEYRFALPFNRVPHAIDSYIFTMQPEYMDKCFANPKMKESPDELRTILGRATAEYGHFYGKKLGEIISNTDVLFR